MLTVPNPTVVSVTGTSITIAWAPATGGTGPYTYNANLFVSLSGVLVTAHEDIISPQTFSGLSPGTIYYVMIHASDSLADSGDSAQLAVTTTPGSAYWTYDAFLRRWGVKNVTQAANKDASGTIDLVMIQESFNYAVDEIDKALGHLYTLPLSPVDALVGRIGMTIAYADLYDVRGWDDKDRRGNKISRNLERAYTDLATYRVGLKELSAGRKNDSAGNPVTGEQLVVAGTTCYRLGPDGALICVA